MTLLVGCFVTPSSYSTQSSGKPRPETMVGRRDGAPIVMGKTRLDDAVLAAFAQIGGFGYLAGDARGRPPSDFGLTSNWFRWRVNVSKRQVALPYSLKTGYIVYPLCFYAEPKSSPRLLVLSADAAGIVKAVDTIEPDGAGRLGFTFVADHPAEANLLFDEAAQTKLIDAGLLPRRWSPPSATTRIAP